MRMEVADFGAVLFNPVAQDKFVHTVSAGYVTGSVFVLAISAFFLIRGRHVELAKRSMTVAASFGLAAALSVVVLGDEIGYTATANQKMKIAAIESMWQTEPAPAPFTVFGLPNSETHHTDYAVRVPWLLGLITTRSINQQVPGIVDLVDQAKTRIASGLVAYDALQKIRTDRTNADLRATLDAHADDLGYALLLKKTRADIENATPADAEAAAWSTVPAVSPLFWSFRIMVGLGFYFILLFAVAFWFASTRQLGRYRWFLWVALCTLPLPWVAAELGWVVAEVGRQPWVIEGVLPTFMAVSSISAGNVATTLIGFIVFYTTLAIVDVFLMLKAIKAGPGEAAGSEAGVPSMVPAE
jgi:cytochrome d ubiquinol oxidase subunit I